MRLINMTHFPLNSTLLEHLLHLLIAKHSTYLPSVFITALKYLEIISVLSTDSIYPPAAHKQEHFIPNNTI